MVDNTNVWKIAPSPLVTSFAEKVSPENVLPEYPRPQLVRERWMTLNGLWDYAVTLKDVDELPSLEGKILVPFPIESALSGVKRRLLPSEKLWYRRTFIIPDEWTSGRILLHFGASDWETTVYINDKLTGKHTGGYCPFTFDITELINTGENVLVVTVWDPTDTYFQVRGKQVLNPHGMWYTPVSGIWQTVWLEPVPANYIENLKMTPDIDSHSLKLKVNVYGGADLEVIASIYDCDTLIGSFSGNAGEPLEIKMENPKLWSPDSPFLYRLAVKIKDKNIVSDHVGSYFGMRKFSICRDKDGHPRLCLNNSPLFMNGVLDQGYWPEGLFTAPSDDALVYDIETAKKLGFNMIRKHIKVEPARWYYHCDRLGMVVWQDMISGGRSISEGHNTANAILGMMGIHLMDSKKYSRLGRGEIESRENYRKELEEMLDTLYNVVSIGLWVPFNESWGQFDSLKISEWIKSYDPTRLVDHASGWFDHGGGDVKSLHIYFKGLGIPSMEKGRACVISEYGGYGLVVRDHVWNSQKEYGYKKHTDASELAANYRKLIASQLKPLISRGLSAAVYTQITDVEEETNGFLTYDRKVLKMDAAFVSELNSSLYE